MYPLSRAEGKGTYTTGPRVQKNSQPLTRRLSAIGQSLALRAAPAATPGSAFSRLTGPAITAPSRNRTKSGNCAVRTRGLRRSCVIFGQNNPAKATRILAHTENHASESRRALQQQGRKNSGTMSGPITSISARQRWGTSSLMYAFLQRYQ